MHFVRNCLENETIEASAPCRIDMGGTLDLSTFYLPLHALGPCTFNAALNMRTRVRLLPHTEGRIKISSRGFDPVDVESASAPFTSPVGLMLAVAAYLRADGVHIVIDSASPPRSALGGSSVAAAALIWAWHKLLAIAEGRPMPTPDEVARLAHAIEQCIAGVPCGLQDHLAAVYGGINGWYWTGDIKGAGYVRRELLPHSGYAAFDTQILVAYCGVPHVSKDINGTWVRDFLAGRHRQKWHRIVDHSRDFIEALADADIQSAVSSMNAETDLRVRMTPEVLDEVGTRLVAAARQWQCGARFTGAGGGGCVWALGPPDRIAMLRADWEAVLSSRPQAYLLEVCLDPNGIL